MISTAQLHAQESAKVYVGGGDEHTGAYDGYLKDPAGWAWVRQNADGYYVNTFPMNDNPNDAKQNAWMSGMADLFTHKNVFYETESEAYANRVFDANDKARIQILQQNGWNLTYTTINGGLTSARKDILQHWSGNRPLLAMGGPWVVGGDINGGSQNSLNWRTWISQTDGSATDSPLAIWASNENNNHNGSYSSVKYAHSQGKKAMIMMCPHGLGTDANWLAMGKQYIRDHEDNDAMPDIWAISYYAAYLEAHAVTPEQVNGQPAASVTGLAYHLIHHLKDPGKVAKLNVPAQAGITPNSTGAALNLGAGPQSFQVNLANGSNWLDLIPVVKARISDPQQAWNVSFSFNQQDVSGAIKGDSGLVFYQSHRLNPGNTKTITVTTSLKAGKSVSSPLTVDLDLMPHPTVPTVNQTLQLHSGTQVRSPFAGVISLPGTVEAENFDNGGEGIAYHDADTANLGHEYRAGEGVDIQSSTEGGYNLGWTNPTEWVEYTVNVATAGRYNLATRIASTDTGAFHLDMDGTNVSGTVAVPNTGGFQAWQTVNTAVNLSAGQHAMRVTIDAGHFNLNKFTFTASAGGIEGGFHQIVNRASGKCLDIGGSDNGSQLQQWDCGSQKPANQSFAFYPTDGGYYRIAAQHTGKVLDVLGGTGVVAPGSKVGEWDYVGGSNQQWLPVDVGGGYYKFLARNSNRALDLPSCSGSNGLQIQIWDDLNNDCQKFRLQ